MIDRMVGMIESDATIARVTHYESPRRTIKVTRFGKPDKRDRLRIYVLTIGRPNFAEKDFIEMCRAVGEPFPVRKFQIKHRRK